MTKKKINRDKVDDQGENKDEESKKSRLKWKGGGR